MRGNILAAGLLLLTGAMLLATRWALAAPTTDPRLTALSERLAAIVLKGKLNGIPLTSAQRTALEQPQYGIRADYGAWISYVRQYRRDVAVFQSYHDLPVVAEMCDDPVTVPWRFDGWAGALVAGTPGVDTGLQEAARAWTAVAEPNTRHVAPRSTARASFERTTASLTAIAAMVDKDALGTVTPEERRLLQFVIPWICRSGGRFVNKSKGAPYYGMEMMFEPNDDYKAGDTVTALSKTPIPPKIASITGLNRYLHALASEPVPDDVLLQKETGTYPTFNCRVDARAMGRALAQLRETLDARHLDQLRADLLRMEPNKINVPQPPGVTGTLVAVEDTPYGKIIVGSTELNTYTDVDALAIFDLGGDDTYTYTKPEAQIGVRGLQVIVDFAGDDLYQTQGVGGPGAGLLGIGVLIDRAGNDRYCQGLSPLLQPRAQTRATLVKPDPEGVNTNLIPYARLYGNSQKPEEPGVALDAGFAFGAGFLGIGVLVDEAGDDLYLGQKFAFGCGFWRGVGVLHDAVGTDVYAAGLASLGAGINGAAGVLDDRAGDDHYQCLGTFESAYSAGQEWDNGYMCSGIGFGSSWRAEKRGETPRHATTLGGGIGIVRDAAGNDSYLGSSFGVAASYAGGIGALIDEGGNDTYFVKRGPNGDNRSGWSGNHALGNGCHRGIGYLLDRAGNDRYSASGLGGGTAWDIAAGFLLDLGGDDAMTDLHGINLRGNTGWGAAKGFAVSYHVGGADRYERGTFGDAASIGDGYPGAGGNFSFFFDIGPEADTYPAPRADNTGALAGVSMKQEADGKEYPQGIGVFLDGAPSRK